jgi:hypothetical protein
MKVYDDKLSEHGPQRRKEGARLLHCCCICNSVAVWGATWSVYCSEKDLDDGAPVPKFCSERCREIGGPKASNVTEEMKRAAKAAEWREPIAAFRDATDREKFRHAVDQQRHRRPLTPGAGT